MTIKRTIGKGTTVNVSEDVYNRLSNTTLKGCPFRNYTAWDLLSDLVNMYSWRLDYNREYGISEFLTECNDVHAETYRDIIAA